MSLQLVGSYAGPEEGRTPFCVSRVGNGLSGFSTNVPESVVEGVSLAHVALLVPLLSYVLVWALHKRFSR